MKLRLMAVIACTFAVNGAIAAPMTLKCLVQNPANNSQYETWLTIDPEANYMRANGKALELRATSDFYSSTTRPEGGFKTVRSLQRDTGELTVTEIYDSRVVWEHIGACEKATPQEKKF